MAADTWAETIGRTIPITAGALLTLTTGSLTISEGPREEAIEVTIDLPVEEPTDHREPTAAEDPAVEGSTVARPAGRREDSMGQPADNPVDNDSVRSETHRRSEDRIRLTPTDRKPYRHSLKSRPHK